jgi:hypothetical protein
VVENLTVVTLVWRIKVERKVVAGVASYCQILWMSGYQAAAVWGLRPSMN